ncbi:C39 family peptidase [bacterium]|nr:C39 family peptidase [bacterium]
MSIFQIFLFGSLLCARAWGQTLLPVPDTRQSTDYSCGAAALQAVLAYYGREVREDQLMRELGSVPAQGTSPQAIVRVARDYGLLADLRQSMQIDELQQLVREGFPTIVCAQAWRDGSQPWSEDWDDGHYLVVIGVDKERVYFEDPSLLGSRGQILRAEFLSRWHDVEGDGTRYLQAGIVLRGKPRPPAALVPIE